MSSRRSASSITTTWICARLTLPLLHQVDKAAGAGYDHLGAALKVVDLTAHRLAPDDNRRA